MVTSPAPVRLYVAPDGNDGWSGRRARRKPRTTDGPFATVARARDAIRDLRRAEGEPTRPVEVCIRGGTYALDEPLVLTPEDSGSERCPVTYKALGREKPVLSGGTRITGWKATTVNGHRAWQARLPDVKKGKPGRRSLGEGGWYFRQLFVNGQRRPRTRLPRTGLYHFAGLVGANRRTRWNKGQVKMRFAEGHIDAAWHNLADVEVIAHHLWSESRLPIKAVDPVKRIVEFDRRSVFKLSEDHRPEPGRYYIENVLEALDTPGQWYLDRRRGVLTYLPKKGESIRNTDVVAPRLPWLVRLEGEPEGPPVHHIVLKGLAFAHTEWELPAGCAGFAQAAVAVHGFAHLPSGCPAALSLQHGEACGINRCAVTCVGTYAVELEAGSRSNAVVGNTFRDLGAGGVKLGHGTSRSLVADNEIAACGRLFPSAVGIWVGKSSYNLVAHNHIHDLFYTGISVGWSWGYQPSSAHHNVVEWNHIHHIGQGVLSDMGGIYTLGISHGTELRHNLIHDVDSYSYGGWGLYTDEGSSEILLEGNIVTRTKTGGFHQHYGRDNVVRNNILAYARIGQIQRSREEDHISFTLDRNIILWTEGPALHGNWTNGNWRSDRNLFWNAAGAPIDFAGWTFAEWKKAGHDRRSRIADPCFRAPERGDFRLKPGSPALKLGFRPIDLSTVGPRG